VKPPVLTNSNNVNILVGKEGNDCDDVPGGSNNIPVFMSEDDIMNSEEINIFVGVGEILSDPAYMNATNIAIDDKVDSRSMEVNVDYFSYRIKKGFRHERRGKSEVRGLTYRIFQKW